MNPLRGCIPHSWGTCGCQEAQQGPEETLGRQCHGCECMSEATRPCKAGGGQAQDPTGTGCKVNQLACVAHLTLRNVFLPTSPWVSGSACKVHDHSAIQGSGWVSASWSSSSSGSQRCPALPQRFRSEASVCQCEGERTCVTPELPVLFVQKNLRQNLSFFKKKKLEDVLLGGSEDMFCFNQCHTLPHLVRFYVLNKPCWDCYYRCFCLRERGCSSFLVCALTPTFFCLIKPETGKRLSLNQALIW